MDLIRRRWIPIDLPIELLDLPSDGHPDPKRYQAERHSLQKAWRERLRLKPHIWYGVSNTSEFELRLERLRDEFRVLDRRFRVWQRWMFAGMVVLLCAGIGIYVTQFHHQQAMLSIKQTVNDVETKVDGLNSSLTSFKPENVRLR